MRAEEREKLTVDFGIVLPCVDGGLSVGVSFVLVAFAASINEDRRCRYPQLKCLSLLFDDNGVR
jgi:hypothetical protein